MDKSIMRKDVAEGRVPSTYGSESGICRMTAGCKSRPTVLWENPLRVATQTAGPDASPWQVPVQKAQ